MIDVTKIMNDVADKDKVPAFYCGFWTITQEELERFTASVLEEASKSCEGVTEWSTDAIGFRYTTTAYDAQRCIAAIQALKPNIQ